jgi:tetratricopeptide (TPR) repeat protein
MGQVEKTVFLSYRRTNVSWALAVFQNLSQHGYDVFFDFNGIASGDFESVILGNIKARAHFVVILTPSALKQCGEPQDWVRREIEAALASRRNIVPLMLEGFAFDTPEIANQLTGTLASLQKYNALRVPVDYFDAAMERLRSQYLNVPLDAVLHPLSKSAQENARDQQAAATSAAPVSQTELTAQEWFERGLYSSDFEEQVRCYDEAIRLKPDFAEAFHGRGWARLDKEDLEGAIDDFNEAIRLKPDFAEAFYDRGNARSDGDENGAIEDFSEAIRLRPDYADAFFYRAFTRSRLGDAVGAIEDYSEVIRLKPDNATAYGMRGIERESQGDLRGAKKDFKEEKRLTGES